MGSNKKKLDNDKLLLHITNEIRKLLKKYIINKIFDNKWNVSNNFLFNVKVNNKITKIIGIAIKPIKINISI